MTAAAVAQGQENEAGTINLNTCGNYCLFCLVTKSEHGILLAGVTYQGGGFVANETTPAQFGRRALQNLAASSRRASKLDSGLHGIEVFVGNIEGTSVGSRSITQHARK